MNVGYVTEEKIEAIKESGILDDAPMGTTHFDCFWMRFLKSHDGTLLVSEGGRWHRSLHKDGVNMLKNGECINLIKETAEG